MLMDCLSSLSRVANSSGIPYEVLVLLQQSSNHEAAELARRVQGVRAFASPLNLGFGGGNNYLARSARGKFILLINDDACLQDGSLEALISMADSDESIAAVASRILFPTGVVQECGSILWSDGSCYPLGRGEPPGSLAFTYARNVDYASANGMLVRRSCFEAAGGFDEQFFPGYYEDVDLCLTFKHKFGWGIVYEPRSALTHIESATSNRDPDFKAFLFRRHQRKLCAKWRNALAYYPPPQPESRAAIERAVMGARGLNKRILVIDDRVPRPGLGSGFGRTAALLRNLVQGGFAVSYAPSDRASFPKTNDLAGLGIDLIQQPLSEHLATAALPYDAAVISRPHNFQAFATALRSHMPNTPIVYDVEALYHRRLLLQARLVAADGPRDALLCEAEGMESLEASIAREADWLVAISDSEADWLEELDGHAPVVLMRPLEPDISMTRPETADRRGAVFVSGWLAGAKSPNVDALRWFATEILPRVRAAIPDFVTYVTGANPPLVVQSLAGDGLVLTGFVECISDLYDRARLAVAPILAGAGVKIKTIEALQYGVPVVATAVGAEGMGERIDAVIDVTDEPQAFADSIISLATDDAKWSSKRAGIERLVQSWQNESHSWTEVLSVCLSEGRKSVGASR